MIRATRIVATIGPASSEPEVLLKMINVGCDIIRLNFSHGTAQIIGSARNSCVKRLFTPYAQRADDGALPQRDACQPRDEPGSRRNTGMIERLYMPGDRRLCEVKLRARDSWCRPPSRNFVDDEFP